MSRIFSAVLMLAVAGLASQPVPAAAQDGAVSATASEQGDAAATTAQLPVVAGTWALIVETSAGTGTPSLMLEQTGGTLTGTYNGRFGAHPVSGTLEGNAIRFTFTVSGPMGSAEVTYAGTVEGELMRGTMQMGPEMGGRFTGRRQ